MSAERQTGGAGFGYGKVPSSLLLVFPLFLIYEIGLLLTPATNGVDFISTRVFQLLGSDPQDYLIAHLVLGGLYLGYLTLLWKRRVLSLDGVAPMMLESVVYALTLGSFIWYIATWDADERTDLRIEDTHHLALFEILPPEAPTLAKGMTL